jgi:predicted phosphodiesterase
MFVRLLSDLHLEFGDFDPPVVENESETVLVLAGDIGVAESPRTIGPFIHRMAKRFRAVVYIMGNHEHYHCSFLRTPEKVRKAISEWATQEQDFPNEVGIPSNVHFVNNEVVEVDNVAFICATLWSNFRKSDIAMWDARQGINDFKQIRMGVPTMPYARKFVPMDALMEFNTSKQFIFDKIKEHKDIGKKVFVVTHFAPSELSILPQFRNAADERTNPYYASELGNEITEACPNVWVHGHTHVNLDYMIHETRIVCNPRGYYKREPNPDFNPTLLIEI